MRFLGVKTTEANRLIRVIFRFLNPTVLTGRWLLVGFGKVGRWFGFQFVLRYVGFCFGLYV